MLCLYFGTVNNLDLTHQNCIITKNVYNSYVKTETLFLTFTHYWNIILHQKETDFQVES